jgi:hypothetical protein
MARRAFLSGVKLQALGTGEIMARAFQLQSISDAVSSIRGCFVAEEFKVVNTLCPVYTIQYFRTFYPDSTACSTEVRQ